MFISAIICQKLSSRPLRKLWNVIVTAACVCQNLALWAVDLQKTKKVITAYVGTI